ncbi:MAG: hypothetical protein JW827_00810 [Spirochaetes bacterium]|nr:hypothetical protein [Spirochaetota bacterium]
MVRKVEECKLRLIRKASGLLDEIRQQKEDFRKLFVEKFHRQDGYILKENLATYDAECESIECILVWLEGLEMRYHTCKRLGAGIRMIIDCIEDTV